MSAFPHPASGFPHASARPTRASGRPLPSPRPTVLLIDDDELVRRAVVRSLRRRYNVTDFGSAEAALEWLATGGHVDAILCDLHLSGMSGHQFFLTLEDRDPALAMRVIILSGSPRTEVDEDFLAALASRFVEKPATLSQIDAVISLLTTAHACAA